MLVSFKIVGKNIRAARTARKLTQEKAAEQIGLSPLHYGRLERGCRPASLEQLARIASVLQVPTLSLLSGSILHEPLCSVPTVDSKSFADALALMTASCSTQELAMITEICAVIARQKAADAAG